MMNSVDVAFVEDNIQEERVLQIYDTTTVANNGHLIMPELLLTTGSSSYDSSAMGESASGQIVALIQVTCHDAVQLV